MEFRVVAGFMKGPSDFQEGVRCRLIDRGQTPQWIYPDLAAVDEAHVQRFFEPLDICPELNLQLAKDALVGRAASEARSSL
jgi:hypothetical protein